MTQRWNHNIHYGRQLLALVPVDARDALDIGCGNGWLVRELRQRVPRVVGIDTDAASIASATSAIAAASDPPDGVELVYGDFLAWPFEPESFDMVTAVASLHHLNEVAALRRAAELLRPGGVLGVVGLARSRSLPDLAFDVAGVGATRLHRLTKDHWETSSPKVWPPPHSYTQVRRLSEAALPGRAFRRRAMFRYLLTWRKPAASS